MRPKLVFTGPTLSHAEAGKAAEVVCLPPAVQGSVVEAVQRYDPAAILIVDGGFQSEPAVRHKEILWAISRGITVLGAASMGALRAAELAPHMRGVGLIYRWYRRFAFAPDDAVAVLHGPREVNFTPLTRALVDLRLTIRRARRRGMIAADVAAKLEAAAGRLDFRERTVAAVVGNVLAPGSDVEFCRRALLDSYVHQKKQDALEALQLLQGEVFLQRSLTHFRITQAFSKDMQDARLDIPPLP